MELIFQSIMADSQDRFFSRFLLSARTKGNVGARPELAPPPGPATSPSPDLVRGEGEGRSRCQQRSNQKGRKHLRGSSLAGRPWRFLARADFIIFGTAVVPKTTASSPRIAQGVPPPLQTEPRSWADHGVLERSMENRVEPRGALAMLMPSWSTLDLLKCQTGSTKAASRIFPLVRMCTTNRLR